MKIDLEYDSSKPLARLEKGDKAYISFNRFNCANEKDREKYKNVPNGEYEAIVVEPYRLECPQYPVLSGYYNYWIGDKRACSELIYANELSQKDRYDLDNAKENSINVSFSTTDVKKS